MNENLIGKVKNRMEEVVDYHGKLYVLMAMVLSILIGVFVEVIAIATYPLMIYGFWYVVVSCVMTIASMLAAISAFVFVTETDSIRIKSLAGTILSVGIAVIILRMIELLDPKIFYVEFLNLTLSVAEVSYIAATIAGTMLLLGAIDYVLIASDKTKQNSAIKRRPTSTG